jgi:hypothetical protein
VDVLTEEASPTAHFTHGCFCRWTITAYRGMQPIRGNILPQVDGQQKGRTENRGALEGKGAHRAILRSRLHR